MEKYSIKITYSWGDEEDHYGKYSNKEKAFKDMCLMAAKEAYVQNEEFLPENTCMIFFDASKYEVDLNYHYDNTWCYYRIIKADSENESQEV